MNNHVDLIEKELEEIENNNPDFFKAHPDLKLKNCIDVRFMKNATTDKISGSTLIISDKIPEEIKTKIHSVVSNFQSK